MRINDEKASQLECITDRIDTDLVCFRRTSTEQQQTCSCTLPDPPPFSSAQSAAPIISSQLVVSHHIPPHNFTYTLSDVRHRAHINRLTKRDWSLVTVLGTEPDKCLLCLVQVALYAPVMDNVGFRCNKNAIYRKTLMLHLTPIMFVHYGSPCECISNQPKADAAAKRPLMILFITTPAGFYLFSRCRLRGRGTAGKPGRVTQIEWSLYLLL